MAIFKCSAFKYSVFTLPKIANTLGAHPFNSQMAYRHPKAVPGASLANPIPTRPATTHRLC